MTTFIINNSYKVKIHKFIHKLNWRLILIHFIAAWFFMHFFQTLAFLSDIELVDMIKNKAESDFVSTIKKNDVCSSRLLYLSISISLGNTVGLLVAFIISLIICIKRKWFWLNSLIVFISAYTLSWFNLLGWTYLKNIFLSAGELFNNTTTQVLINSLILLTLGLLFFFFPALNRFITKRASMKNELN